MLTPCRTARLMQANEPWKESNVPEESGRGELRVSQRQPLHALAAEVDLQARIVALAFGADHRALTELGMHHRLPDAERQIAFGRGFGGSHARRRCRSAPGAFIHVPTDARGQPFEDLLRHFVEETAGDVVARLAM